MGHSPLFTHTFLLWGPTSCHKAAYRLRVFRKQCGSALLTLETDFKSLGFGKALPWKTALCPNVHDADSFPVITRARTQRRSHTLTYRKGISAAFHQKYLSVEALFEDSKVTSHNVKGKNLFSKKGQTLGGDPVWPVLYGTNWNNAGFSNDSSVMSLWLFSPFLLFRSTCFFFFKLILNRSFSPLSCYFVLCPNRA